MRRNIMFKDKLKMNLQMFAADDGGGSGGKNPEDDPKPPTDDQQSDDSGDKKPDDEPTVTVAEMQRRLVKAEEKAKEEAQKALDEAERLAKMNADEKKEHELEKMREKIAEYERDAKVSANAKIVSSKLSEAELPHDDALIELLTTDNDEQTESALGVLIDYVAKIKKNNTVQSTPNEGGKFNSGSSTSKSLGERAKEKRIIK